jgi:putative SOS response-associated peptidase YedK
MCDLHVHDTPRQARQAFQALITDRERDASFNITPTSDVYVVLDDGEARKIDLVHLGFVPGWAKDLKFGNCKIKCPRRIRHQVERLQVRVQAEASHPARGRLVRVEERYRARSASSRTASRASTGNRSRWQGCGTSGEAQTARASRLRTVTIITTGPQRNDEKPIHDRMQVILPPEAWEAWLDPTNDDTEALAKLLEPAPVDLLVAGPVFHRRNSTHNDSPDLVAEVTADQLVG